jgi:hypothetical protein
MTAAKTNGTAPKGLHAKLAEVMGEVERIPKNGTAPAAMGGFKFVQVGDAADVIRKALGAQKVSMLPTAIELLGESEHETSTKKVMTTLLVRQTWTLTDGETGETATIQSIGAGADTGDKAAPKAMTAGMKYAILTGFLMSTGDDPETADTSDRQVTSGAETLEMLGNQKNTGVVKKGGAQQYQAEWREEPDGTYAIGFRLQLDGDDKDIPQVVVKGDIGKALYLATSGNGAALVNQRITVKGKLWFVRQTGRTSFYRLVIGDHPDSDYIETADVRIPAKIDAPAGEEAEPSVPEAPSLSLPFDAAESARLDAEEAAASV